MMNKKSKKIKTIKAETNDSSTSGSASIESSSSNSSFTPFTSIRKSFKRLKRKKDLHKTTSTADEEKENDVITTKSGMKNNEEKPDSHVNNHHNIIKRITSGNGFRLKKRKNSRNVSSTNDIHKFDVIEWSSCESLSENFEKRTRKHNSLRRSKASLLMPTSGKTKASPPSTKITRYSSLNNILENKSQKPETAKSSSVQNVASSDGESTKSSSPPKEQTITILRDITTCNEKRKRPRSKITSTSLPNIYEERLIVKPTSIEIEGDIDFSKESNNDTQKILKELLLSNELNANKKLDIFLGMNQQRRSLIILDEENKMFGSSPFLNRPPIPSDPKPVSRRDQAFRRWVSTEGLSPKKRRSEYTDLHHPTNTHKRAFSDCNFMIQIAQEKKLEKEIVIDIEDTTDSAAEQKAENMVQNKEAINKTKSRNLLCSSSVTSFGSEDSKEKEFGQCSLFSSIQNIPSFIRQNDDFWMKTMANVSVLNFFFQFLIFSVENS